MNVKGLAQCLTCKVPSVSKSRSRETKEEATALVPAHVLMCLGDKKCADFGYNLKRR